ncbi:hypothetical protein D5S17_23330 [Pseudonocardiaceae bacterium YIM PH 21723]|nr:hypothetical protein D5S17_23330 [Pseudonocardiaceae bacterium YIM PH 21723]
MSRTGSCGPYIDTTELKEQRGWTKAMIEKFLGEPDRTAPNPGGRGAARVKLWLFTRVQEIEATNEFKLRMAQAITRRMVQGKG